MLKKSIKLTVLALIVAAGSVAAQQPAASTAPTVTRTPLVTKDLSMPGGIPRVRANRKLTFFNSDDKDLVWHTITTCAAPCTASTGIAYPLANAMPALDSLEMGTGFPQLGFLSRSQPASGKVRFSVTPSKAGLQVGQTYTYFCRIHPFMRGAFKVVK